MKMFEIVIGFKAYSVDEEEKNGVRTELLDRNKLLIETENFDKIHEKSKKEVFKEFRDEEDTNCRKFFPLIEKLNKTFRKYNNEKSSIFAISLKRGYLTLISKIDSNYEKRIEYLINKTYDVINNRYDINTGYGILVTEFEQKSRYREISTTEFFVEKINQCLDDNYSCENCQSMIKEYLNDINEHGYSFRDLTNRAETLNFECLMTLNIGNKLTKVELQNRYKDLFYNKDLKDEIDRIYNCKKESVVNINPVHYVVNELDESERKRYYECIGTALYSVGRVKNRKGIKLNLCIGDDYITSQSIVFILKNSIDSFVAIDFASYRPRLGVSDINTKDGLSRLNEISDAISLYKDHVQFAFNFDKYNKEMEDKIVESLHTLVLLPIESKIDKSMVSDVADDILKDKGLTKNSKLEERLNFTDGNITRNTLSNIIDDWEKEEVIGKYYPEYSKYYAKNNNYECEDPYKEFMNMIGLDNVKKVFNQILDNARIEKIKKEKFVISKKDQVLSEIYTPIDEPIHMAFMGNPGTAKTTVAKLFAKILFQNGVIRSPKTIEYNILPNRDLRKAFERAYGGILFIDEAYQYAIAPGFLAELCDLMESQRQNVIVILAGYYDAMRYFIEANPGLESRIKYKIEFSNYDEEELWKILNYMLPKMNLLVNKGDEDKIKEKLFPVFSSAQVEETFGNGRLVRNILDTAKDNVAKRLMSNAKNLKDATYDDLRTLKLEDFDMDYKMITGTTIIPYVKDPLKELNDLIGLKEVKEIINMLVFRVKMSKVRIPMHLAFLGNPGTGKTTVARLLAFILKKYGIIKKSNIVEVGRKDLISTIIGGTAPKVKAAFDKAKGGILFIDEAYSLLDENENGGYGEEAVNTIVQEMENRRNDVIVILAGYTQKTMILINSNDGLQSRISYFIKFEDYNLDELLTIFDKMLIEKNLIIAEDARNYFRDTLKELISWREVGKLGNARYIRKIIEKIIMNKDSRLAMQMKDSYSNEELTEVTKCDIARAFESDNMVNGHAFVGFAA